MITERRQKFCGTQEGQHTVWCNSTDNTGIMFATIVWVTILYAAAVCILVFVQGQMEIYNTIIILVLISLSLWAHLKTMLGDPGAVPSNAFPLPVGENERSTMNVAMCGRCDGYKPPGSHHDRISNRCISRMDHFCPWMNNAIGARNQKNFMLFLIYTVLASSYMYIVVAWHMVDCTGVTDDCRPYVGAGLQCVRVLIFVLLFAILFTSSMILNQVYGLAIGLGTIDRMKSSREGPESGTPVPFQDVFGSWWLAYFLPLDPYFDNEEEVFKYKLGDEKYQL
jgi:hypothetical protein